MFAAIGLGGLLWWRGQSLRLHCRKDVWLLCLQGALLSAHWVSFFAAIQWSTVAVGLLTFATFPIFTTLLEPLFFEEDWKWRDVLLALVVLLGIGLVVPPWDVEPAYFGGGLLGVFSGLSFAVLALLNRSFVRRYPSAVVAWYQDVVAAVVLLPFLMPTAALWSGTTIGLLALLGLVFTALAHTLFIQGLERVRAQTASLIASLEPVYGILAAAWWLAQWPPVHVWLGGGVILGAIGFQSWWEYRERRGEA